MTFVRNHAQAIVACDFFIVVTASFRDLRQYCFFSFRKQQPIFDLPSQDPVLRRQIFVSQQEFLIDCSGDIGEQARPKHLRFPCNLDFVKREIVGAVSKSEKPIRKGSLCKILSCAISSHSSFLTTRPTFLEFRETLPNW